MLKSSRGFVAFLFIFSLIITFSNPADASEKLLFDKVLTISDWYVHASQHSFNAADTQEARIKISKNTPDKEIQRGFFVLNGAFTFMRDFLAGDELVFEKDVTLKAANTLFVFLLGQPKAELSFQVVVDEGPAPEPEIIDFTAAPLTIKRGESATLSWQTTNAESCKIEPDVGAVDPNGSISVTPTNTTNFTLTAEGTGDPATATVTVTIENSAPVAEPQTVPTDEDTAVAITLTATDVDGDSLIYTVTAQPGQGTLSGTPPALNYSPNENYNGPDAFSFTASDGEATSEAATVNITVKPVNDPPEANDDQATTNEDTPVVINNLLANDTDVDNDSLTITTFSQTANGQLVQQTDGSFSYTPNLNFSGADSFTYTISDGSEGTATATVSITVIPINDAPVAEEQTVNLNEDESKEITLGASDAEGDSLTFHIVAGPSHGELTGDVPNMTYTPQENYHGSDSFSFKTNDGKIDSNSATVSLEVNPINDAPVAQAGPDQTVLVRDTVTLNGSNSLDVDQDIINFNWSFVTIPGESKAAFSDSSAENPIFTPDVAGAYKVQLIVNDGKVDSPPDQVVVTAMVEVPDVVALPQADAEAKILKAGLVVGVITTEYSETVPEGSVISQSPVAGTPVVGNSEVDLTISLGSENQPPSVIFSASPPSIAQGESSTLTWSSLRAVSAHIDNGIGAVDVEGDTLVSPEHTTTYTLTVTGPTGSENAKVTVLVAASPEPQPEGSYGERYEDLVPPDATIDQYDPERFSLITGLVHDFNTNPSPLPGVTITVHNHAEYGSVTTDDQGRFSIPVEGGGILTVVYEKQGLIPVQRKVYVPWNDNAIAETVVMITEDPVATTLTFNGNADTVVTHKSEDVVDESGMRAVTMVFSGDNKAYLVDEQGNDVQELTTITTRATEYPIPEAMPARLPPNSAFTYCAELSVDGAQRVRFDKPVTTFIDNFLGFPVGSIVPVGYYDRDKGVWVPSENGVVVELLDIDSDGIVDGLDADGDSQPDDLDRDGTFGNEVKGLGDSQRYASGATFWRVATTHFTPFDCNWPGGPPQDAIASNADGFPQADTQDGNGTDPKRHICSFVEEKSRIFHEDISIPGTDMTLHYGSSRVAGYKPGVITIPASSDTVPQSLIRIDVFVDIAGKQYKLELPPSPNQTAEIGWDGRDHLGRPVAGAIVAHVRVGFVYYGVYYLPSPVGQAFGQPGIGTIEIQSREEIVLWTDFAVPIIRGKGTIAEGWTLSLHHQVSPLDPSTIIKGDGTVNKNNAVIIDAFAGNGQAGFSGLDGPATEASIGYATNVETDTAGNLYIGTGEVLGFHWWDYRVLKVDTDGIVTTAVNSPHDTNFAIDAQGNFYDPFDKDSCVFKIDSEGNSSRVAGICDVNMQGFSGDGGPATSARLNYPGGVDPDNDGNLYIADTHNHRIRKVDVNGVITTVAGSGPTGSYGGGFSGDGGLATEAELRYPHDVAIDKAGNLFIADGYGRVRKVDPSGIITTVAGNGTSLYAGDGVPATETGLYSIYKVEVDAAGNFYIVSSIAHRVWKVDTAGIITTVAGSGPTNVGAFDGDGGPATSARLNRPYDVAIDAAGNIYIVDNQNWRIRKVSPPAARLVGTMSKSDIAFTEENGIGYIMSSAGLHKKTIDLDTGVSLYEFSYDEENNLVTITDQFANLIKIERSEGGVPTAIISPDGIRTELTIDAGNHLTHITYPDGNFYRFDYSPDGLLELKTQPKSNQFGHIFDSNGRITDFTDDEGGHWLFSRTMLENGDVLHETQTQEGDLTSYLDRSSSTGAFDSTITDPADAQTNYLRSDDGLSVEISYPCGDEQAIQYNVDPEYKFKFIEWLIEMTPSGLLRSAHRNRSYEDTDSDGIADLITETVAINDKATSMVQDVPQAIRTMTSPEGRTLSLFYDAMTLSTTKLQIPGLYDTDFTYDTRGRIKSITANERQTLFDYVDDENGHQQTITIQGASTTVLYSDAMDRLRTIERPDGGSIEFEYDDNGNMEILTNPAGIDHGHEFNNVNRLEYYHTPISGRYRYQYDKDRRLTEIQFPSLKLIKNTYANGRLELIETSEGNVDLEYYACGNLKALTKPGEQVQYSYDGSLLTSETNTGTLNQSISYGYNDEFLPDEITYAGGVIALLYDNDGLLTGAGNYTIDRNSDNGLPETVNGGALTLNRSFSGYGEIDGQTVKISNQDVSNWSVTKRDNAGRILQKTESIGGISSDYLFSYDSVGRLLTVSKDDVLVEEYLYDTNGTRNYEYNSLRDIAGRNFTYSDEDHLLTAGETEYKYDEDGFLTRKTHHIDPTDPDDPVEITTYDYSSRGELLFVTLPDNTLIEYVHDPLGRRIAKKVGGTITEKYLWQGMTRLLAVYDGSGNLLMRFEYADDRVPMAVTTEGVTYYLAYDQVGSLRVVADSAGVVLKRIDYDSFGNIIADTNEAFKMPLGFAGGLHDRDTRLVRFGYRDYDPDVGRWTAKDPILFAGGDSDLYEYVLNDPANFYDPYGLIKWGAVGKGVLAAFGGGVAIAGGALASSTGVGAIGGVPAVLIGSAGLAWGISQIVAGFLDNEIPFMGTKEAIIKGTTETGLLQDELLGVNTLGDMLLTGRTAPTEIGKINDALQSSYSIYESGSKIVESLSNGNSGSPSCQ